jgi:hypothetical protein
MFTFVSLQPWVDCPSTMSLGVLCVSSPGVSSERLTELTTGKNGDAPDGRFENQYHYRVLMLPDALRELPGGLMPFPVWIVLVSPYCAPMLNQKKLMTGLDSLQQRTASLS